MATKNNPGEFDYYSKADPDEPMFVLLGRDEAAHLLVRAWAFARLGKKEAAIHCVICAYEIGKEKPLPNLRKINEAMQCAHDMAYWTEALKAGIIPKQPIPGPIAGKDESH